jgi:hypothetical protein
MKVAQLKVSMILTVAVSLLASQFAMVSPVRASESPLEVQIQNFKNQHRSFFAATDRCEEGQQPLRAGDRAIVISRDSARRNRILAVQNGSTEVLGVLSDTQITHLQPYLRSVASAGLVAVYGVTVVGTVAFFGFAYGMAAFEPSAAAIASAHSSILGLGSAALALEQLPLFLNVLNPVAQFERGNTERCLIKQIRSLNSSGETIVIRMNDKNDFGDTRGQLKDLIHDLN